MTTQHCNQRLLQQIVGIQIVGSHNGGEPPERRIQLVNDPPLFTLGSR